VSTIWRGCGAHSTTNLCRLDKGEFLEEVLGCKGGLEVNAAPVVLKGRASRALLLGVVRLRNDKIVL
jgi:hypothetical protein